MDAKKAHDEEKLDNTAFAQIQIKTQAKVDEIDRNVRKGAQEVTRQASKKIEPLTLWQEEQRVAIALEKQDRMRKIEGEYEKRLREARGYHDREKRFLAEELDQRREALRVEHGKKMEPINEWWKAEIIRVKDEGNAAIAAAKEEFTKEVAPLEARRLERKRLASAKTVDEVIQAGRQREEQPTVGTSP